MIVKASDSVQVIGSYAQGEFPSILGALATSGGTAGNLRVETGQMSIQDGAAVAVSSLFGQAGNSITTQGMFGIEFRPQLTPKNDITVSSKFGLAGVYTQTTPAVDPSRGLAELPVNVPRS